VRRRTRPYGRGISPKTGRRNSIAGSFTAIPTEVLESPAWRVLSLAARRALDRLCLELRYHAGRDSAKLCVTYQDFEDYGIRNRHSVSAAIRELEALGFVRITRRGRSGNAEHRRATRFRLTFINNTDGELLTNEWKRISSLDQASRIAAEARKAVGKPGRKPVKKLSSQKQNPSVQNDTEPRCQNDTENARALGVQHDTTVRCVNDTTIYSFHGEGGRVVVRRGH
jgi:hypothetical protein